MKKKTVLWIAGSSLLFFVPGSVFVWTLAMAVMMGRALAQTFAACGGTPSQRREINVQKTFGLLSLLLGLWAADACAQAGLIEGIVETESGTPLPNANLVIEGTSWKTSTTQTGRFSIPQVPAGAYAMVVSRVGYRTVRREVLVREGETTEISLTLQLFFADLPGHDNDRYLNTLISDAFDRCITWRRHIQVCNNKIDLCEIQ